EMPLERGGTRVRAGLARFALAGVRLVGGGGWQRCARAGAEAGSPLRLRRRGRQRRRPAQHFGPTYDARPAGPEELEDVMGRAGEAPLALHVLQAAEEKLPHADDLLELPADGLDGHFALVVLGPALRRPELGPHALLGRGVLRERLLGRPGFSPLAVADLLRGDVRLHSVPLDPLHVPFHPEARIRT